MDNMAILALFLAGITAGSEAGSYFFLRPAKSKLPPQQFIELEKSIQDTFGKIMPVLMIITTIAIASLLIIFWSEDSLIRIMCLVGLLAYIVSNAVTIIYMLPINNQTAAWNTKQLPQNWREVRNRWEQIQSWRTFAMLLSFAALCTAVVLQIS
jgi:uncharacterized membrane protein